jgi:hypothetical protein
VEFATLVAADLPPSLARDALRVTRTVFPRASLRWFRRRFSL